LWRRPLDSVHLDLYVPHVGSLCPLVHPHHDLVASLAHPAYDDDACATSLSLWPRYAYIRK
uniref:Uncharacterized protein n=1 Tax=Triticum urartu TaxID=4572 RepID=A0A8R7U690_TRIUA